MTSKTIRIIRCENDDSSAVGLTLTLEHVEILQNESHYMKEFDFETETSVTLVEDDPFEALLFIIEIIKHFSVANLVTSLPWKPYWAVLSAKWIIPKYVNFYDEFIKRTISELLVLRDIVVEGTNNALLDGTYSLTSDDRYVKATRSTSYFAKDINHYWTFVPHEGSARSSLIQQCLGRWSCKGNGSQKIEFHLKADLVDDAKQRMFIDMVRIIRLHVCYQSMLRTQVDVYTCILHHKHLWGYMIISELLSTEETIQPSSLPPGTSFVSNN